MKNIRIHIFNEECGWDDSEIYVDIKMQSVPRIGEIVWFTEATRIKLIEIATNIATNKGIEYLEAYEEWFNYGSSQKPIEECKIKDLSFSDAIVVKYVVHDNERKLTHIILNK
jgi:hypothetical protein